MQSEGLQRQAGAGQGRLSRRTVLAMLLSAGGASLLAACQAAAPTTNQPAPTAGVASAGQTAPAPTSANAPAATNTPAAAQSQAQPAASATQLPRSGGILRAGTVGDYVTLDGHYYTPKNGLATWIIYDTMTRYDDNLQVQPMLAESWEQSADARQLTLHLRKGVTFHNGRDFTSDDVLYNFTRVTDYKVTAGIISGFIPPETTWSAPDKYTVVVTAKNPWPAVFDWLEVVGILDKDTMEGPEAKSKAVGTGPFTFVEWVQGDHVTYGKNKNYWQTGRPYLDGTQVSILRDQQAMTGQLEGGALDLAMVPTLQDFNRIKADPKYQGVTLPNDPDFYMIQPNATLKPLDNKLVRQAFAHSIDRTRMLQTVLTGIGDVKSLPWSPGSPAFDTQKNATWTFDLDKATTLLQQAGATNLELEMVYNSQNVQGAQMSQIWQADLAKIGVKLNIRGLESATLLDMWHNQTYQGFYIASDAWTNMQPITFYTSSSVARTNGNNGGYKSDAYMQKVNTLAVEGDPQKRQAELADLNDFLLDQAIVYPIATNVSMLLATANVRDIGHRRIPLFKFTDTWLAA
jgi:peptide/nickel transport system substrate-binding protein